MQARVEVLETPGELGEMAADWRQLAERAGNPFVSPEWFQSVLPDLGSRWRINVIAIRRTNGELFAVLPFVRSSPRRRSEICFAGAERAEILQPAADPDDATEAAAIAARALAEHGLSGPIRLGRVDPEQQWWRELAAASRGRRRAVIGPIDALPCHHLPPSWEEYRASRSRNLRSQLGRKMRALRNEHAVEIRQTKGGERFERDLDSLFRLHDRRWATRPVPSSFGPHRREFHRRFARAASTAGWARIHVMEIDGEPAAAWYGWRIGSRTLYYQAGFDPAWHRHSVGLLLLAETIRGAIEEGCEVYDMLHGEEEFKSRFADGVRHGHAVTLVRPLSGARLAAEAETRARRAWRRIPEQTRSRLPVGSRRPSGLRR